MLAAKMVNLIEITHVCTSTLWLFKNTKIERTHTHNTSTQPKQIQTDQQTHFETEKQIKFTLQFLIRNFRNFFAVCIASASENWPKPCAVANGWHRLALDGPTGWESKQMRWHHAVCRVDAGPRCCHVVKRTNANIYVWSGPDASIVSTIVCMFSL